jgi:hypothetical protein
MRHIAVGLLLVSTLAAQTAWRYVPQKPSRLIAMEWRKVLESPYSAQLRRELPPESAAALGALNIIEGIDRVVFAVEESGSLIVLEGDFDRLALKDSAAREGATVKPYKNVEIITPADVADDDVLTALVSAKHILLGYERILTRAIDRAEKSRAANRASGYDLWIATDRSQIGWQIGENLKISGTTAAKQAVALEFKTQADYEPSAGRIRAHVENGTPLTAEAVQAERPPDRPGGTIRIYGLEEGVREIPLSKPKQ